MVKVAVFVGTRPEAIKLAPVIKALQRQPTVHCTVVSTGQHREMLIQTLAHFKLTPDLTLDVMMPNQSLASLSGKLFNAIDEFLTTYPQDWIVVQGDTTTAQVAATCGFYRKVAIGHVEAGLRSHSIHEPFPEEFNRRTIGLIATHHFAPTQAAYNNLITEGYSQSILSITGNTGIDALRMTSEEFAHISPALQKNIQSFIERHQKFVLITGHRRENFGTGFQNICKAISLLAAKHPDIGFLYPVHLNPNVWNVVKESLTDIPNVCLAEPAGYREFTYLLKECLLVLTDSGGVQEEAPTFGKPVIVMREVTERRESVDAGLSVLVGAQTERIVESVSRLITDQRAFNKMVATSNPYGDGFAAGRIADTIVKLGSKQ